MEMARGTEEGKEGGNSKQGRVRECRLSYTRQTGDVDELDKVLEKYRMLKVA